MFFRKKRIFADAAAGTPLGEEVKERLLALLSLVGNPSSIHAEGVLARKELDESREEVATALRAIPSEILFTSGGTEANNLAIFGAVGKMRGTGQKSVHIITSVIEHPSVLECVRELEQEGCSATYLPVNEGGLVSPRALREAVREDTALVSLQYVNSEIGTVQDIREFAKVIRHARKERAGGLPLLFHTDASQAPLYLSCNVQELGVDLMTLDGQKIMGPKGAGLLYVRRGVELVPLLRGGGQERGLRSGTENVPLAGACARALSLAQGEWETRAAHVREVRNALAERIISAVEGALINGSMEERVANNLNVSIPGLESELGVIALDAKGIAVSSRSACNAEEGASYVIEALGHSSRAKTSLRITFLPSAHLADAQRIAEAIGEVKKNAAYAPLSGPRSI